MPSTSSSSSRPGKGRRRRLRIVAAGLALLGAAGYAAYEFAGKSPQAPGCTVRGDGATLDLSTAQASNAATIAAVATARGLPERAVTIALATSLQESRLRNLDHGDRDSLGLFQQRPSQGWGSERQILDPVYATNAFYDGLVKIEGYSRLPLTVAAQRVQKSGYPQAYAKHEADAALLSAALTGRAPAALTCTTRPHRATASAGTSGTGGADGAPDGTAAVTARLTREFGSRVRPRRGAGAGTVWVPSSPAGGAAPGDGTRRGWELAQWAVAHADDLKVEQVAFGGLRWQAARSGRGWQKPGAVKGDAQTVPPPGFVTITVAR